MKKRRCHSVYLSPAEYALRKKVNNRRASARRRALYPEKTKEAVRKANAKRVITEEKRLWIKERGRVSLKKYRDKKKGTPRTPRFKIDSRMSTGIRLALKSAGTSKAGRRWEALVGYTRLELMTHLESLFLPLMSWNNIKFWHIDHKIPLAVFEYKDADDAQFKAAWCMTNLRPLWAADNIKKSVQDKALKKQLLAVTVPV